jgi:sugar (pentulose or hexulose) kinase
MVHCNNCTTDLDAWVKMFGGLLDGAGASMPKGKLYDTVYALAAKGDPDCGGIVSYNYYSGEQVTELESGKPMMFRKPDAVFSVENLARSLVYSTVATLKIGNDILSKEENVPIDRLMGHGGLFKTPVVGQRMLAAALNAPVTVMDTASEGGPWGMAVLTAFMLEKEEGETLEDYLDSKVFADAASTTLMAEASDIAGFSIFLSRYKKALPMERCATEVL